MVIMCQICSLPSGVRNIVGLLLMLLVAAATITNAVPLASVHMKLISPPHVHEHEFITDGGTTIAQNSYFAIGQPHPELFRHSSSPTPSYKSSPTFILPENAEFLWPVGVFMAPINVNDLGHSYRGVAHLRPDVPTNLGYPDPYLLTGQAAVLAVAYLYGRGELFYHDIPHTRAILKNQEERRRNGLPGNILGSLRPSSPFYKKNQLDEFYV